MTSNWEGGTGRLHYTFINFTQITQKFDISSYIDDIGTNFVIVKHTLRVFHDILKKLLADVCFRVSFICYFLSCCVLFHF